MMAAKYNVSKTDVLLSSGGTSAAVRLALGETQIVDDTRKFLEAEGVKLEAFDGKPQLRSKKVILAKNLPAFTSIEVIRDMFAKHGDLQRVVMPPGCLTCLLEFSEATEARTAFK
jgi:multiple RNA-binding domain-containing protein 1